MAKYEDIINGSVSSFVDYLIRNKDRLGASISLEDYAEVIVNDVEVSHYVFERYSYLGNNRVSLSLTLIGYNNQVHISAITSGGSQAVFLKINTFGENAFLDKFIDLVNRY